MRKILGWLPCGLLAFGLMASAAPAQAALITDPVGGLTLNTSPTLDQIFGQTNVSPCIIGPPNCQNPATFPLEPAGSGGGGSVFTEISPIYTAAQISSVIGATNSFTIGIDFNQSNVAQTLFNFTAIYIGSNPGVQSFSLATVLPTNFNGEGFSDFILSGFLIPSGTTNIVFFASWFNNDGADRFFLKGATAVPCTPADCPDLDVAEPAMLALLGMGMLAAGLVRRRYPRQP